MLNYGLKISAIYITWNPLQTRTINLKRKVSNITRVTAHYVTGI